MSQMPDTEPENYSIDEMLKRLRAKGEAETENVPKIVTRADGSQAMRVRKRKRRSEQPHKKAEARRRKRGLVVATLVTVLVVGGALGALAWVIYLNNAVYRDQVAARLGEWTGAEVEITQFRATPVSVAAGGLTMTWPEDSVAARLKLSNVVGDLKISSHLSGQWSGEQLRASSGNELVLRDAPDEAGESFSLPDAKIPFNLPARADNLRISFGEGPAPAVQLNGTEGSVIVPDPEVSTAILTFQGGQARVGEWGTLFVKFASFQLGANGLSIGNVQLYPEGDPGAEIRLTGENLPEIRTRGGQSEMRVQLKSMPTLALLGTGLGRLIDGEFETLDESENTGRLFADVTDLASVRLETPIRSSLASPPVMLGFDFCKALAEELNDPRFVRPRFESQATAQLLRDATSVRLEGISFLSQGMLRLAGTIEQGPAGALGGTIEVGLPESMVAATQSAAVKSVFGRQSSGYRWATVTLSGTTDEPADDLREQFQGSLRGSSPAAGGDDSLERSFLDLTTPRR